MVKAVQTSVWHIFDAASGLNQIPEEPTNSAAETSFSDFKDAT